MSKIKERFEKYDLLERAKQCPFKQFFLAPPMQASGVLIHQLLLRKVKSQNPTELQFFIGDSNLRFGLGEFALITALNFAKDLDIVKYKSMSSSMRLRETYLNNAANVRSCELEAAFLNCEEKEDVWKLGLCYLVDGLLMAQESSTKIMMDMLSFVENEEEFFNYPWGRRSYERTFPSLNKDMLHQRENYIQKMKNNKKDKEAKYTVYGFSIALQYWAYEAIPKLTGAFCENLGIKFPRMLLLKMMEEMKAHRQPTGSESEATQSDVLPEGYQPGEDVVISTPTKEHTPEEQQTPRLPTGDASTGFFFHLQTSWKWLADEHIDAAFRLIRECLWLFPKTYRKKVALADTVYIACMNGRWDAFRRTSNKAKFLWDDQLTDYAKRDADHFQRGWAEVDEVYYPLNIDSNHWVLVQIDLPAHMLTVYDSD
ncbi:Ulp1 protease family, C-terminal catalytic domain containing protein [Parasponia andersonii]|uniref:Ulp1 protease family, C-terminal catalytic domain containing protein n=1 Tax=Parasponia andersonii TaxID=3476 RepID=A0A2P5CMX4_PARAD|nr:Ulp1 protease family, C-terminal catalytic domain containing protein [Parasponia andersonii]